MYEYEMFKSRERELHGAAATARLVREAREVRRTGGGERGLLGRLTRSARREAGARTAGTRAGGARAGAAAGCA
ncbi:hypothetical protein [Kitasatospora sp. NPDC088134]|uniref:hypothetical protein n=1 Tax=Kitasatospora sp. NPDC088134 TaxID=3364071 RepID=UPI00382A1120